MKTTHKSLAITVLSLILLTVSCTPFEELTDDPNSATTVPPSLLLSGILRNLAQEDGPWSEAQRDNQFWVISFDYYGDQDYNWGAIDFKYDVLANVEALEEEAAELDSKNKYGAMAKFLKAYYFDYMSKRVGDIPLTEALQGVGEGSIEKPAYDSQKKVYEHILALLEEANTQMALARTEVGTGRLEGDPLLNGDLEKWQKVINSFHLRVLIGLSERATEIDVPSRFQKILNDPAKYPLMESNEDNLQRVYGNEQNNFYVLNPGNFGFNRNRNIMGATYLDLLKERNDHRIFVVADPAPEFYDPNKPEDFSAYIGANTGDEQGPIQVASDNGQLSYPNEERYYDDYSGEPYIILGYPEQEFTIAEAINRGWISADATAHYRNGIEASMLFYNIPETEIENYLSQDMISYKGDNGEGFKQILTQKYIAFFNNSGREAYFNYRRTGIPNFDVGPSNNNGGQIPLRWKYPQSEFQNNEANVNQALSDQFGGTDDINGVMWLIE
ncbi:SusD-like starch-binding protein associating with outer membrane [Gillisia sp. Hel_I_86]|uniref:SusD/RagB family nutrient-binding outer membrane lipoprotein n=1 Tax=Gillisia sp. Hel_I_86 TaxID=1249981 RepID=UPI00119A09EC|nr:SusD/RagB family nutrient-binding outer membrane lipoprotein [Gillisia sp. Hel_I_86]TVZ25859.1 SusD-like starch-binding protein associating with outer membrane [Gillisia sp. Hel_I_86]